MTTLAIANPRPARAPAGGRLRAAPLLAAALVCAGAATPSQAALKVLACEPEWAALAEAVAGPLVQATSATTALQDPHQIQARPSLIARARAADLLLCTGAELEAGWLPPLQQQSGNARIQPGQPGLLLLAEQQIGAGQPLLGVPGRVDRSMGDVHASGNPHLQMDPRRIATAAAALSSRLAQLDAANAAEYRRRGEAFQQRWREAMARWQQQAAALAGLPVAVQHDGFAYLVDWLGLQQVAVLESKPGVEPGPATLQQVLAGLKARPARAVLVAAYQDDRPSRWLSQQAGVPAVKLPFTVGGSPGAQDLFGLFDDTLARLLAAAGQRP